MRFATGKFDVTLRGSVDQNLLTQHQCINQQMVRSGGLCVWDFDSDSGDVNVRVSGQLKFNTSEHIVDTALAGLEIAFLPQEEFGEHIRNGHLIRMLEAWCRPFSDYYLYYPSRKQPSPAFSLVVETLRVTR